MPRVPKGQPEFEDGWSTGDGGGAGGDWNSPPRMSRLQPECCREALCIATVTSCPRVFDVMMDSRVRVEDTGEVIVTIGFEYTEG
ncbi:MAG: hypothetical protein M1825_004879 [Sarcosagium campestre]|nr:MAG: hypothetical protein M1825_004879 [Sarcosagium campestre]